MQSALRRHWPEYLIEGWALSCLMISICVWLMLFESTASPLHALVSNAALRIVLVALGVGISIALLIQTPWGKRSGAHMNPAITIAFLRLKKVHPWDALFYVLAQMLGGTLGVVIVAVLARRAFTDPPVHYAITEPGPAGEIVAFMAEILTSFALMGLILTFTASPRLIRFTGLAVGVLVTILIAVESPLSGTSMNPARTLASALPGLAWAHLWLYLLGPTAGMLMASEVRLQIWRDGVTGCAKLLHPDNMPCIHCGYVPGPTRSSSVQVSSPSTEA